MQPHVILNHTKNPLKLGGGDVELSDFREWKNLRSDFQPTNSDGRI